MRFKVVIKRIIIGIIIFVVAMWVIGFIMIKTGYQPPEETESAQDTITETPKQQPDEPQAPPSVTDEPQPVQNAITEVPRQQPDPVEPRPALLEPIDPARTDIDPGIIKYDIASVEPAHIGIIKRYACRVVVYQRLSKAQLALIADTIYQSAQKEIPFNALKIIFYDYPQLVHVSARLGYVDYAPNGKWEDARTVKTGDYSKMKMIDHLFEPDWTNAFTEQEAIIYGDYVTLERQYVEVEAKEIENGIDTGLSPMERAMPDIARQYNMSQDDVWELIMKAIRGYEKKP
jgi:hypothetical protein